MNRLLHAAQRYAIREWQARNICLALVVILSTSHKLAHGQVLPFANTKTDSSAPIEYRYELLATRTHARDAFTQGLEFDGDVLLESTGKFGGSRVARINLDDGNILAEQKLHESYFGEGITLFKGQVYQLTWRAQQGFIYDSNSLQQTSSFRYKGEGWGLTHNKQQLIMSNGSDQISFRNTRTFGIERSITVTLAGKPVGRLNELEWVEGYILANVWLTDRVVVIDPKNGAVVATIDLSGLLPSQARKSGADVLNGIAYHSTRKELWVTGKYWPHLYQIKLIEIKKN